MRKTDYSVIALIVLNYTLEAALLTHVDGFVLPPVAVFAIAVALAPIGPLLGILPQLGVRVPTLISPTTEMTLEPEMARVEPIVAEPAPLHPAP